MNITKFKTFLKESGAVVLEPTNEYEVIRFRTENGVSIVYRNKRGTLKFTGESKQAYEKLMKKTPWTIVPKGLTKKKKTLESLIKRDGSKCFYCGLETTKQNRTIEHILSVSKGGNNDLANLAISCSCCNLKAGDMPIVDKVLLRESTQKKENESHEHQAKHSPPPIPF